MMPEASLSARFANVATPPTNVCEVVPTSGPLPLPSDARWPGAVVAGLEIAVLIDFVTTG